MLTRKDKGKRRQGTYQIIVRMVSSVKFCVQIRGIYVYWVDVFQNSLKELRNRIFCWNKIEPYCLHICHLCSVLCFLFVFSLTFSCRRFITSKNKRGHVYFLMIIFTVRCVSIKFVNYVLVLYDSNILWLAVIYG